MTKAYVTSIGEKTTDLCVEQLRKYGFDVTLIGGQEPWVDKYKRFIEMADEDCIRVDADIVPNKEVVNLKCIGYMTQFRTYDLYKNGLSHGLVYYSKKCLDTLKKNIDKITEARPETSAWRLPDIVDHTYTSDAIVGMHGFFQDDKTIARAEGNKFNRKQIEDYDFELVKKLRSL